MASIILSSVGSAVGGATGIPGGALLGRAFGRLAGGFIDQRASSRNIKLRDREGPRLADLAVQTSTYGKMIPMVYGTVRIAGNLIWSRPIQETVTTSTSSSGGGGGKGGGGRVTQTTTTYSYSVSLAVGICEGEVNEVLRVWADAKLLDLSQYTVRIYTGSETQTVDSYIQSVEGAGSTPAYRGMAYVVFENFPLADFGNRIPNFTFEVRKTMQAPDYGTDVLEDLITGVTLIPGAGEFVYDTQVEYKVPGADVGGNWVQQGAQERINLHNPTGNANVKLSLDQLQATLPNLEWVSVVVGWFGDTMDISTCVIKPGVEYQTGATTQPDVWGVGSFTRATARQITLEGSTPRYGGTPSDASVLRLLTELRARGLKIMFYPFLFMDVAGKPWRGELGGSAGSVSNFFTQTNGYNAFITHYANLVDGYVDAFVIGSEMKALNAITDAPGSFPAVSQFVSLAATVKSIVGSSVKVTYAADWSEYHHTDGGYYHLDPLWASTNIDVVGIDAYFPLTDQPQSGYSVQDAIDGWTSGEGYDFYYTDAARTTQASLSAPYAWKNISWWWNNTHTNPGGAATAWVPGSKKIWFTEYGFPSVDGATNQPNVFYDPTSSGSAFPYHSRGRVDVRAQRQGLVATEEQWKASTMVEQKFIWTWDARPYPYFPDLTGVWADGANWKYGHWLQGKLGLSSLAAVVKDVCLRTGLSEADVNVSALTDRLEGFVISSQITARAALEQLVLAYAFDAVEGGTVLNFVPRGSAPVRTLLEDNLARTEGENAPVLSLTRAQELELPKRVNVLYLNRLANYQTATQYAQREATASREIVTVDLPLVLADQVAKTIADITLFSRWTSRSTYRFYLPIAQAELEPADVIDVSVDGFTHRMRITAMQQADSGLIRVDAVADDAAAYDFYTAPGGATTGTENNAPVAATELEFLDIPALPGDAWDQPVLRYAGVGLASGWQGAAVYRSDDGGSIYNRQVDVSAPAVLGTTLGALPSGTTAVFDEVNTLTVSLLGDATLESATELAVLNGANAAMVGAEMIQFKTATLVEPGKYVLSGLLRGRMGTEWAIAGHAAGERFALLSGALVRQNPSLGLLGLARPYKGVSVGSTLADTLAENFTYTGVALKPYAPVQVAGSRDGSGNLTLTWVRRARAGAEWQDFVEVPLNETAEAYEVEILNGASVVRTLTGISAPSAAYSAADQVTDFGSAQSTLSVRVYQLSEWIGRGYATAAAV